MAFALAGVSKTSSGVPVSVPTLEGTTYAIQVIDRNSQLFNIIIVLVSLRQLDDPLADSCVE
ncbi:MAG: hypothetical protein L6R41_001885 [Letrouitia leprolyta]|nr:MAG: hypothetical protein L6R41_001885 [Letrouitia leprolyta]